MERLVYGFAHLTIEEVRQELEKLLGIQFEPRHSYDRCGDYYAYSDRERKVEIYLQDNCEEDPGEWTEDEHRDMGVLLYYVVQADKAELTRDILQKGLNGATLLR